MKKIEIYDGTKTYMYPNGDLANRERMLKDFPAILTFTHIIETDEAGEVCFAVENLNAMRSFYNIDSELSKSDAVAAIQELINTPQEDVITPEERIASALEFQNMMSLPDEEVE